MTVGQEVVAQTLKLKDLWTIINSNGKIDNDVTNSSQTTRVLCDKRFSIRIKDKFY